MATLWGKLARTKGLKNDSILVVRCAKISEYGDISLSVDERYARIEIDPNEVEQFRKLKAWHLANKNASFNCMTNLGELGIDQGM